MQIVRLKLEVLEADIERMKKNHRDDILARNFELLWCWLNTRRANGHENGGSMVIAPNFLSCILQAVLI